MVNKELNTTKPKLLEAVIAAMGQKEIRKKVLITIALLLVFRFVAHIPVPGVDSAALETIFSENAILGFLNIFSGGALENLSIAALGVYPFITATIVMQLMQPVIPKLQALAQEGEHGRNRIQIYTMWLTVPLALFQAYAQLLLIQQFGGVSGFSLSGGQAIISIATILTMVAGTMFLVWIGERISESGIGNGVSLIIFGGIVAGLPSTIGRGVVTLLIVALIVTFQEAQRRIPVQYSKSQIKGGKVYRQQGQSYLPLRVNTAGMIPLIFAFSIMIFPPVVAQFVANTVDVGWVASSADFVQRFMSPAALPYWIAVFLLVVLFTFFYTMVVFQQQNLADNLQKQGGFIPGIRPGPPTQQYINRVLVRITWGGAIFLGFIAIVPFFATSLTNVQALQIGAAGLLIVVGVVIDTMRQLEAQMSMRNYEGFM
jgi:preprotein translocase subunit SecY